MNATNQRAGFPNLKGLDEDEALRTILEGTAIQTGEEFFSALVQNLARALNTHGAWVTEYLEGPRRLRALAFWLGGEWVQNYEHVIDGTPCEAVVTGARLVHYPERVLELYPNDPDIQSIGVVSYLGVPLIGVGWEGAWTPGRVGPAANARKSAEYGVVSHLRGTSSGRTAAVAGGVASARARREARAPCR